MRTVCCGDYFGHNATCSECFISTHATMSTHWAKAWQEGPQIFVRRDISLLRDSGFAIPLGHGGNVCPATSATVNSDDRSVLFHLVDANGIHNTAVMGQMIASVSFSHLDFSQPPPNDLRWHFLSPFSTNSIYITSNRKARQMIILDPCVD